MMTDCHSDLSTFHSLMAISEQNTILSITSGRNNILSNMFFLNKDRSKVYLSTVIYFFPNIVTSLVGCYLKTNYLFFFVLFCFVFLFFCGEMHSMRSLI